MATKKKKAARKKAARKTKVVKTRNAGTMSESAFWSFIRSALRQKSRWWKPILQVKMASRRAYKGPNKRQKFEYQCNMCKQWFAEKNINIDHIKPVGSLKSANDLPVFVENLFCEADNLQVLCSGCHDEKTIQDNKLLKSK